MLLYCQECGEDLTPEEDELRSEVQDLRRSNEILRDKLTATCNALSMEMETTHNLSKVLAGEKETCHGT